MLPALDLVTAVFDASIDLGFLRLKPEPIRLEDISVIDYAIMEKLRTWLPFHLPQSGQT